MNNYNEKLDELKIEISNSLEIKEYWFRLRMGESVFVGDRLLKLVSGNRIVSVPRQMNCLFMPVHELSHSLEDESERTYLAILGDQDRLRLAHMYLHLGVDTHAMSKR